jgi:hypothetical protein
VSPTGQVTHAGPSVRHLLSLSPVCHPHLAGSLDSPPPTPTPPLARSIAHLRPRPRRRRLGARRHASPTFQGQRVSPTSQRRHASPPPKAGIAPADRPPLYLPGRRCHVLPRARPEAAAARGQSTGAPPPLAPAAPPPSSAPAAARDGERGRAGVRTLVCGRPSRC